MLAVFTYANELGPQPGLNSPECFMRFLILLLSYQNVDRKLIGVLPLSGAEQEITHYCSEFLV